jgi:hypothetical protein
MVEATPPIWKDAYERCGRGFACGESRWIEQRQYTVHTECAQWELWDTPPYSWKLKELRKQYRQASANRASGSGNTSGAGRVACTRCRARAARDRGCASPRLNGHCRERILRRRDIVRNARQRLQRPGHGPATMDKPPTKPKPSAKQDAAPDEPDAEARERIERLRQLADDYTAAFHRKPNPEDYKRARKLREMSRPDALLPETELIPEGDGFRVREIPDQFIRVSGKAINAALKNPLLWERETWMRLIPDAIKLEDGDALAVARDLIAIMPASLRAKCARYPGCPDGKEDWDAFEARTKEVAAKIHDQVQIGKHGGPLDLIEIGRAVLSVLGAKRPDDILRRPKDQGSSGRATRAKGPAGGPAPRNRKPGK